MLHLDRRDAGLTQRNLDGAARTIAVLRPGSHVIGVRCRAIADQFGNRCGAAAQGMVERFDDHDTGAFAHDEAVAVTIEWA